LKLVSSWLHDSTAKRGTDRKHNTLTVVLSSEIHQDAVGCRIVLSEEHRLRMFEVRLLRRIFGPE
jgi:hypothetical protein